MGIPEKVYQMPNLRSTQILTFKAISKVFIHYPKKVYMSQTFALLVLTGFAVPDEGRKAARS
jgi:hypothetical protein